MAAGLGRTTPMPTKPSAADQSKQSVKSSCYLSPSPSTLASEEEIPTSLICSSYWSSRDQPLWKVLGAPCHELVLMLESDGGEA